jgi:predicted nucleotidyltransferase
MENDLCRRTRYCRRVSSDAVVDEIGRRLAEAAPARSRVVLFGSRARGESHAHSDVDVLVIEPFVDDPIAEAVRLRSALRGLKVPIDVVVFAQEEARRRSAVRGTVVERALREGRILVDA